MVTHSPLQIAKHYISHEATRRACCQSQCSSCFSVIGVRPRGMRSYVSAKRVTRRRRRLQKAAMNSFQLIPEVISKCKDSNQFCLFLPRVILLLFHTFDLHDYYSVRGRATKLQFIQVHPAARRTAKLKVHVEVYCCFKVSLSSQQHLASSPSVQQG